MLILMGIVVTCFLAQLLVFLANIVKKPSSMMPFGYVAVLVGFLAYLYLFNITFNLTAVVGIMLTSAGLLSEFLKNRSQ